MASLVGEWSLIEGFRDWDVSIEVVDDRVMVAAVSLFEPILIQQIKNRRFEDPELARIKDNIATRPDVVLVEKFSTLETDCILAQDDLKQAVVFEAHHTRYSIHSGSAKMYRNLKDIFLVE